MEYPKEFDAFIEQVNHPIQVVVDERIKYFMYVAWLEGQTVATKAAISTIAGED